MKCRRKLSKHCSIPGKIRESFRAYKVWKPVERNTPDVWNWNCWTLFYSKIEMGGEGVGGGGRGVSCPSWPSQWLHLFRINSNQMLYFLCIFTSPGDNKFGLFKLLDQLLEKWPFSVPTKDIVKLSEKAVYKRCIKKCF